MAGTGEQPGPRPEPLPQTDGMAAGPRSQRLSAPPASGERADRRRENYSQHAWRRFAYIAIALVVVAFVLTIYYTNRRLDQVTLALQQGRESNQSFLASNSQARQNYLADQRAQTEQHMAQAAAARAAAQQANAEARRATAEAGLANAGSVQASAETFLANAQTALAEAQTNRANAIGPARQLAQQAQATLARAQAALADAQAQREAKLTALTGKLVALLAVLRAQVGRPAGNRTAAQRQANDQLALEVVQVIEQISPTLAAAGRAS